MLRLLSQRTKCYNECNWRQWHYVHVSSGQLQLDHAIKSDKPPKQNNPAGPTFWILGTCNTINMGIGMIRSITSVTNPAIGGRIKSKCFVPAVAANHHKAMTTPTIVVQVRKSGCTKILRMRSRMESFVTAMMVGCRRSTVYHS